MVLLFGNQGIKNSFGSFIFNWKEIQGIKNSFSKYSNWKESFCSFILKLKGNHIFKLKGNPISNSKESKESRIRFLNIFKLKWNPIFKSKEYKSKLKGNPKEILFSNWNEIIPSPNPSEIILSRNSKLIPI